MSAGHWPCAERTRTPTAPCLDRPDRRARRRTKSILPASGEHAGSALWVQTWPCIHRNLRAARSARSTALLQWTPVLPAWFRTPRFTPW